MTITIITVYSLLRTRYSIALDGVIDNISSSDVIKLDVVKNSNYFLGYQIDLLSNFITIFCTGTSIIVAIFGIFISIRSSRVEDRFRNFENIVSEKNNDMNNKISKSIVDVNKIANNENIRELILRTINEKNLIYLNVKDVINELFEKEIKKDIFSLTEAFNKEIMGASELKFQLYESIMRKFFKSITNSMNDVKIKINRKDISFTIINKDNFDKILDKFSTDLLIINYFYSVNIKLIEKGLGDYISTSKNPQFLAVLKDLKTHHNDNPDLYPKFINAIKIAKIANGEIDNQNDK